MLVVVSDTHGTDGHRLSGRSLHAVREAEIVVHAGDFTTRRVLAAFRSEADRLRAVHGNSDVPAVTERLPATRTVDYGGVRLAVSHHERGGDTGLAMLGRQREADAVIHGHTHRPRVDTGGPVALLNPGSHADPRGNRPAHAELRREDGRLAGRLVTPRGETVGRFELG